MTTTYEDRLAILHKWANPFEDSDNLPEDPEQAGWDDIND